MAPRRRNPAGSGDELLRELERAWRAGDDQAGERLVEERIRRGLLPAGVVVRLPRLRFGRKHTYLDDPNQPRWVYTQAHRGSRPADEPGWTGVEVELHPYGWHARRFDGWHVRTFAEHPAGGRPVAGRSRTFPPREYDQAVAYAVAQVHALERWIAGPPDAPFVDPLPMPARPQSPPNPRWRNPGAAGYWPYRPDGKVDLDRFTPEQVVEYARQGWERVPCCECGRYMARRIGTQQRAGGAYCSEACVRAHMARERAACGQRDELEQAARMHYMPGEFASPQDALRWTEAAKAGDVQAMLDVYRRGEAKLKERLERGPPPPAQRRQKRLRNPDDDLRALERAAASGDRVSADRLHRELVRRGRAPSFREKANLVLARMRQGTFPPGTPAWFTELSQDEWLNTSPSGPYLELGGRFLVLTFGVVNAENDLWPHSVDLIEDVPTEVLRNVTMDWPGVLPWFTGYVYDLLLDEPVPYRYCAEARSDVGGEHRTCGLPKRWTVDNGRPVEWLPEPARS